MNRKEYETKRQALINEAEALINEGKLEEANKKMEAVTELDKNFEAAAKAEANLRALSTPPLPLSGVGDGASFGRGDDENAEDMYDSVEYRKAFMNYVLKGTAIPEKFRNVSATTKTTDVGSITFPCSFTEAIYGLEDRHITPPTSPFVLIPIQALQPTVSSWLESQQGSFLFGHLTSFNTISVISQYSVFALEITCILQTASRPMSSDITLISAVPSEAAISLPLRSTSATALSDDSNRTFRFIAPFFNTSSG